MAWITYNGIDSRTLGVVIETMPDDVRGERYVIENVISGRNGALYVDNKSYASVNGSITINCMNNVKPSDIYRWLSGEGYMITSDAPTKQRYVRFYPESNNSRYRVGERVYDSVTVNFVADPYMISLNDETLSFTDNANVFNGQGDMITEPLIVVTPSQYEESCSVILNGSTMLIRDTSKGAITIDCDAKLAYYEEDGVKHYFPDMEVSSIDGVSRWAVLKPVSNLLTIDRCSVTITPRWRFF